ncbi:hypothetical protein LAC02_39190 [Ligilactobacillus acidipiscis]|nr:hypothetical protein LAC02_39190 [Ligilactobacillus acidipiscis]
MLFNLTIIDNVKGFQDVEILETAAYYVRGDLQLAEVYVINKYESRENRWKLRSNSFGMISRQSTGWSM